jgi:hypothetical protein
VSCYSPTKRNLLTAENVNQQVKDGTEQNDELTNGEDETIYIILFHQICGTLAIETKWMQG